MPVAKLSDQELLPRLLDVFCAHGYEGASLTRLSEATGLERASLYHRFPGGKEEMADAILAYADKWFEIHVFAPLRTAGAPEQRIRRVARKLREFYDGGRRSCLLETLSLQHSGGRIREHLRQSYLAWVKAFAAAASEAGLGRKLSRRRAQEAIAAIHGSLVLARVTGETELFRRTLKELPQRLTQC